MVAYHFLTKSFLLCMKSSQLKQPTMTMGERHILRGETMMISMSSSGLRSVFSLVGHGRSAIHFSLNLVGKRRFLSADHILNCLYFGGTTKLILGHLRISFFFVIFVVHILNIT